jgi:hypothetical protein
MDELTGSLSAFAEFMGISSELLACAARRSEPALDENVAFRRWADTLPPRKLAHWLERLVFPSEPHARAEVLQKFRSRSSATSDAPGERRSSSRPARANASRPRR